MKTREATLNDVENIVRVHLDAFDGFFLTTLGSDFLRFYYTCFLKSQETVTMISEEEGKVYGFAASTMHSKGFNSRLIRSHLIEFTILSLKMLFTTPSSLLRLIKNLTKKAKTIEDNDEYAELYSIGVGKDAQGKGVGKLLLSASEMEMKSQGVKRLSLTTDYGNNEQAIGFYHAMGYRTMYVFTAYPNRKMYRLIKEL